MHKTTYRFQAGQHNWNTMVISSETQGHLQEPVDKQSPINFDILITGAGVAGLLLALECKRLGLKPTIIERQHRIEPAGMLL